MGGQVLAAIDVGSNTVRLLVAEVEQLPRPGETAVPGVNQPIFSGWRIRRLRAEIRTTRLGEKPAVGSGNEPGTESGAGLDGRAGAGSLGPSLISSAALERTIRALKEYQDIVASYRPAKVWAVGTSALREAANRDEVVAAIARETGFQVEIIGGTREGELGYQGACLVLAQARGHWPSPPAVIDIGGGSTEITVARSGRYQGDKGAQGDLQALSLPLGAVRCTQAGTTLAEAQTLLKEDLRLAGVGQDPGCRPGVGAVLIGIGGTITALGALDLGLKDYDPGRVHGHLLKRRRVQHWWEKLASATPTQRREFLAFDPPRAEIIVAGAMILYAVLLVLHADQMVVSDTGLLHGMLMAQASVPFDDL